VQEKTDMVQKKLPDGHPGTRGRQLTVQRIAAGWVEGGKQRIALHPVKACCLRLDLLH